MPEFLKTLLIRHFGGEKTAELWPKAEEEYKNLVPLALNESKSRRKNLVNGIFPYVAVYRSLLSTGTDQNAAMEHMYAIMEMHTLSGNRKNYEKMGRLPFFFPLFRKMFSIGLKGDSWNVEWVANDSQHFIYNIRKCLWHDTCTRLGHPELCRIFCRNDILNFTDVSKHLYFDRSSTLAEGGDCCDFHFYPKAQEKQHTAQEIDSKKEPCGN